MKVLLALFLCASLVAAQDDDFVRCTKCRNVGARPCPEHEKADCELEGNVLFCSAIGLCPTCGGTGWVDCPACENVPVEERLAAKRAAAPAVAAGLAYLEEDMRRPLLHAESAHFVLVWDVEALKVDKKRVGAHELLHRYIDHLERLYDDYTTILGVKDAEFVEKSRVMVWINETDHEEASRRYCDQTAPAGVKLMGIHPTFSVPYLIKLFKNEEFFRRYVIHNATHLLLSHQEPMHWIGETKGGWADAGLAHWFEDRYFGVCDVYCYTEADTRQSFKGGRWKPEVRRQVAEDEAPSLAGMFQKNTDGLTLAEHAVAFSLVDYLIATDARKLNELFRDLRKRVETREALAQVFGLNPIELEERWKAWVLETYPVR